MKRKILFVCLGNICRSPMARAIFDAKLISKGLTEYYSSDSCGTAGYHIGDPADHRTIECVKVNGIKMTHSARQLRPSDLGDFDYILAMDASNFEDIHLLVADERHREKIRLMRSFAGEDLDVPDPYYGTSRHFQEVFEILDNAIEKLIKFLEDERKKD